MRRHTSQILSVGLSIALVLGSIPASALPAWAEGSDAAISVVPTESTSSTEPEADTTSTGATSSEETMIVQITAEQPDVEEGQGIAVQSADEQEGLSVEQNAEPTDEVIELMRRQNETADDYAGDAGLSAQADLPERRVDVATWAELQKALDGSKPNEFVHIWMKGDITAAPTEGPLTVSGSKTIKIHMEGHTLSRGLTIPKDNGYVMYVGPSTSLSFSDDQAKDEAGSALVTGGNNKGNGGAFYNEGSLAINHINVSGNKSQGNGGAFYNTDHLYIYGPTIENNEAQINGGAICSVSNWLTLNGWHNYLINNVAHGDGGGIYNGNPAGEDSLTYHLLVENGSGTIRGNTARNGGGIYNRGSFICRQSYQYSVEGNTASGNGGGIYSSNAFDFNGTVSSNVAHGNGGGAYVQATREDTYRLYGSVEANTADGNGGGVYIKASCEVVLGCDVNDNKASGNGGGIFVESGSATVQDRAHVEGNEAQGGNGGGIYVADGGGLLLHGDDCLVSKNVVATCGGGVYVSAKAGTIDMKGSVKVRDNTAKRGSGVYLCGDKKMKGGEFAGDAYIEVALEKRLGEFTTEFQGPDRASQYYHASDQGLDVQSDPRYREGRIVTRRYNAPYIARSWNGSEVVSEEKTQEWPQLLNETRKMTGGFYTIQESWTTDQPIEVTGDSSLIIPNYVKLTTAGIYINKGCTLTVYGQNGDEGTIVCKAKKGAGIGAAPGKAGGNLVVHGGKIEATGGPQGAGIGGSDGNLKDVGSFTMYGGSVTARGGQDGAGIGGGQACEGGVITIYGGSVEATGGARGAGIGGGNGKDKPVKGAHGGTIGIWGGSVVATGGEEGAGIGGGEGGNAGSITIAGGKVTARGGNNAAGIGCGEGESTGVGGTVTISGGNVTATGGEDGAGIGGGEDGRCDKVTISGGEVRATGGKRAAGVGGGNDTDGGTIEISGEAVLTARAGDGAAGIGSGCDGKGVGNVVSVLDRATVTVYGGNEKNAPIGAGRGKVPGSLEIYDRALVTAGASEARATRRNFSDRVPACQDVANGYARIEWCTHGDGVEFHDEGRLRVGVCRYCHAVIRGGLGAEPFRIETANGAPSIDARNMADVVGVTLDAGEIDAGVELLLLSTLLSEVPGADRAALEARAGDLGATPGLWFDVSLYKDLEGDLEPVHEVGVPIALEVEVPDSLRAGGREFWLLECHDGEVIEVAHGTGEVLAGDVDRLSTFLIAYRGGQTPVGADTSTAHTSTATPNVRNVTVGAAGSTTPTAATSSSVRNVPVGAAASTTPASTVTTRVAEESKSVLAKTGDRAMPAPAIAAVGLALAAAGTLRWRRQDGE